MRHKDDTEPRPSYLSSLISGWSKLSFRVIDQKITFVEYLASLLLNQNYKSVDSRRKHASTNYQKLSWLIIFEDRITKQYLDNLGRI